MGQMWSLSGLLEWYFKEQLVSDGNDRYMSRPLKLTAEETIYSTICNSSDLTVVQTYWDLFHKTQTTAFPSLTCGPFLCILWHWRKKRADTFRPYTCSDLHMDPLFLFQVLLRQPESAVPDWLSQSEPGRFLHVFCLIFLQRTRGILVFFFFFFFSLSFTHQYS